MNAHVELQNVSHRFPAPQREVQVLERISLHVERGSVLCLVGTSGCGKSTLLNLIAGFLQPTAGVVLINGTPVCGPHPRRVLMFQESALFPWRNVLHNTAYGLELAGLSKSEREQQARAILRRVGLGAYESFYPSQLSGGMKQRVALARTLAVQPELILMDEPFAALDVLTRRQMQSDLSRLWSSFGATVILVTHDIEEAVALGDRVAVLAGGPAEVRSILTVDLGRPRNRHASAFVELSRNIYQALQLESPPPLGRRLLSA